MTQHNVPMIVMIIIAILLLFTTMVLSAMASSDASKSNDDNCQSCHKYSMYSAIVTGISVFIIFIGLMIYLFRKPIAQQTGQLAQQAGAYVGGQLQQYGMSPTHMNMTTSS